MWCRRCENLHDSFCMYATCSAFWNMGSVQWKVLFFTLLRLVMNLLMTSEGFYIWQHHNCAWVYFRSEQLRHGQSEIFSEQALYLLSFSDFIWSDMSTNSLNDIKLSQVLHLHGKERESEDLIRESIRILEVGYSFSFNWFNFRQLQSLEV